MALYLDVYSYYIIQGTEYKQATAYRNGRECVHVSFMISADVCDALPGYKRSLGSSW